MLLSRKLGHRLQRAAHGESMTFHRIGRQRGSMMMMMMMMMGRPCCCIVSLYTSLENDTGYQTAVMVSLLLTSDPVKCEPVLPGCGESPLCLFYTTSTLFQVYHGCDMICKMIKRWPDPTLLPSQSIFNLQAYNFTDPRDFFV